MSKLKTVVEIEQSPSLAEAMASVESKVRDWRKANERRSTLANMAEVKEFKKLDTVERDLRKLVAEALPGTGAFRVDGLTLMYSVGEKDNGLDFEKAWNALPEATRKRHADLLVEKPKTILHKLVTE